MEWIKITNAKWVEQGKLHLTFNDGVVGVMDFAPIADGGVLRKLNESDFFKKFEIVRNGRALEWPDGIDFCADALHEDLLQIKYANQSILLSATNK